MDGTSPGLPPMSLGDVWVGTTACAPNPQWLADGALCGGQVAAGAMQACIVDWPAVPLPYPLPVAPSPYQYPVTFAPAVTITTVPTHPRLSDEDIDRIADRVLEKLRGALR